MKKNIKRVSVLLALSVFLQFFIAPVSARQTATVDYMTYALSERPSGLNITYYSDIYSRGFAWQTEESIKDSELWILKGTHGEADSDLFVSQGTFYNGTCETLSYAALKIGCHKAQVEGLTPGETYSYRVGGAGQYLYGTFEVAKENDPVVIVNLNDAQTRSAEKLNYWENTVSCAMQQAKTKGNVSFIAFGGDLYDRNMSNTNATGKNINVYLRWGMSLDTIASYRGSLPFVEACGNHDGAVSNLFVGCNNIDYAGILKSKNGGYYSFDYGNVHYVVLPYMEVPSTEFNTACTWLEQDLKAASESTDTDWIIVQSHWGPYTTGDHGTESGTKTLTAKLTPLFSKYHVDLVLQAHDHTFSKTVPYRWNAAGYETRLGDTSVVNLTPNTTERDGITYDLDPWGTYYISAGAAGHRIGENTEYAKPGTGRYLSNYYKTQIGKITVDSAFGKAGDDATGDLNQTMYGILTVKDHALTYDFYVATEDGKSVLFDSLNILKSNIGSKDRPLSFSGEYLRGIKAEQTSAQVAARFEDKESIVIVHKDGSALKDTDYVGTGCLVRRMDGDKIVNEAQVVVRGETNGDGVITTADYMRVRALFSGKLQLTGAEYLAADTDENESITTSDYMKIRQHFAKKYNLYYDL